jgi:hypothetical protein
MLGNLRTSQQSICLGPIHRLHGQSAAFPDVGASVSRTHCRRRPDRLSSRWTNMDIAFSFQKRYDTAFQLDSLLTGIRKLCSSRHLGRRRPSLHRSHGRRSRIPSLVSSTICQYGANSFGLHLRSLRRVYRSARSFGRPSSTQRIWSYGKSIRRCCYGCWYPWAS